MEKWSPKSSRSSRLTSYIQEGERIEENKRTSNIGEIKTHKINVQKTKGTKSNSNIIK